MNFRNETIYIKAKELRDMVTETDNSAYFESSKFSSKLQDLCMQIPLQIGMSINIPSFEDKRIYLEEAEIKLIELYTIIDLHTSEYFKIDYPKFDNLVKEILNLIAISLDKIELDEEERMDKILEEHMNEGMTEGKSDIPF